MQSRKGGRCLERHLGGASPKPSAGCRWASWWTCALKILELMQVIVRGKGNVGGGGRLCWSWPYFRKFISISGSCAFELRFIENVVCAGVFFSNLENGVF